ncbi:MAG: PH domain-containing protein, partial [Mycobacterium sp.]|nr:PH domain-containing protein [Mycobacterium sp.]
MIAAPHGEDWDVVLRPRRTPLVAYVAAFLIAAVQLV